MYLEHFGLKRLPFCITPDARAFYRGSDRGVALQALCFAISRGEGITKVVGEVGTGKTMLCRMLPLALKTKFDWVYLPHPSLSPEHILHTIAYELGVNIGDRDDKLAVMRKLQKTLLVRHAKGRHVVVLIEEAQGMPIETLEEIRLLSNLETDRHKLIQIVLFGQPELDEKLSASHIRQLKERISYSIQLQPLSQAEVLQYANFRLRAAGYRGRNLFDRRNAKLLYKYSGGLIRRINILCDKTLLSAYAHNRLEIAGQDIRSAAQDCRYKPRWYWMPMLRVAVLAACCILGGEYTGTGIDRLGEMYDQAG
ncbi:ExeA family protein [Halioxenophilus aromaticivorans]|uniref:MSHA fimbrial biogenesis protein MshM n=1 Tax=Halioxenophilus aromaticivorans TaxID=1306992 RepID=A0AAV3U7Z7_9ALTE